MEIINFVNDLVVNSTTLETLRNFKELMDFIGNQPIENIEVTSEGAISFEIIKYENILSSAIGDKNYYIIVSNSSRFLLNEKYSISDGYDPFLEAIKLLKFHI